MDTLYEITVILALLGAGTIGGVFFAFSSFIMKALARVSPSQGIAAMQSINVVVINPSFLGTFLGTAILSIGTAGIAYAHWDHPSSIFLLGGSVAYLIGTMCVTISGNVPLNDRLALFDSDQPEARGEWTNYLERWTRWNHVRTIAALVAALLFYLGLNAARMA